MGRSSLFVRDKPGPCRLGTGVGREAVHLIHQDAAHHSLAGDGLVRGQ